MLSSIHPLGERSRTNQWILTVGAFAFGSGLAGSLLGASVGLVGSLLTGSLSSVARLMIVATVFVIAGIFDLARFGPPGPKRQVNESWIGAYRGWVYGGAFGAQLGFGLTTYVVTWGVWAIVVAMLLTSSIAESAAIGALFGLGRAIPVLAAGWIDRPSRLTAFNRRLVAMGPSVVVAVAATTVVTGVALMGAA